MAEKINPAEIVTQAIASRGWTQEQFARAADVSAVTTNRWVNGKVLVEKPKLAATLSRAGIDPEQFGLQLPAPVIQHVEETPQWAIDQHDAVMAELQRIVRMLENRR